MMKLRDDRGSLPLAMLLTIVGVGLSGLLSATLNVQFGSTKFTAQRADSLDAAHAGLQIGLGHIRAAAGDKTKLPCGPFNGAVTGATRQTYSVVLYYLTQQPPAGNTVWAAANRLSCTGTYLSGGSPQFVMLQAVGLAVAGQPARTVAATYTLRLSSIDDIPGGLIHVWSAVQPPNPDLCFAAPSASPAVNAVLTVQICDNTSDAQKFVYGSDNQLVLAVSRRNGSSSMCLETPSSANNNQPVSFHQCSNGNPQDFWYTASHNFDSFKGTICYHINQPVVPGSQVTVVDSSNDPPNVTPQDASCSGTYANWKTFKPDPSVGLGMVLDSGQLVSFGLYNSCVANDAGVADMQGCENNNGAAIDWNYVWTLPDPSVDGPITTTNPTGHKTYCLVSPGTTTSGTYVTISQCPTPVPASMTWHRSKSTGLYATSYRLESGYGVAAGSPPYCLRPIDPNATPPDPFLASNVTRLVIATCDGTDLQKWNAPTAVLETTLTDVTES